MRISSLLQRCIPAAALIAITCTPAGAQNAVDSRVFTLYASAEYEEALSVLGSASDPSAQFYRSLCLMGLGQQQEAEAVVGSLIAATPEFTVSAEEVPPRFLALLTQTRRQLVPAILRKLFAEAREQYQAKAVDKALPRFERIVAIASQGDLRDVDGVADLRILADGFIELAKAGAAAPRPAEPAAAAPAASPTAARASLTPPAAIKQEIPAWPLEVRAVDGVTSGAVRVQIDKAGRVTGAEMVRGIHPRYDTRVLAATRHWEYTPATLNGAPIPSESVVEIRVNPPDSRQRKP